MKSKATIILGTILVGLIAITAIASAGYIGATTASNSGTPSSGNWNGMMGDQPTGQYGASNCGSQSQSGGMMGSGMMGWYGYAETNGSACPHMDNDDIGLNSTAHPCMG